MKIDSKKLLEELKWTFIDLQHNGHMQVSIKDGQFVQNKYVEKQKDAICYVCNLLTKIKKQVYADIEEQEKKGRTFKVKGCTDGVFEGIPCLEMEDKYGFFKSENDQRPSQCTWIKKKETKYLYKLFTTEKYEFR